MTPTPTLRFPLPALCLWLLAAAATSGCADVNKGTPKAVDGGAGDAATSGGADAVEAAGIDAAIAGIDAVVGGAGDTGVSGGNAGAEGAGTGTGGPGDGSPGGTGGAPNPPPCPSGPARTFYVDADRDGFGNPAASVVACDAPANHVDNDRDCDDTSAARKPGSCTPATPAGLSPTNGHYTGSLHATAARNPPLRPELKWAPVPGARRYEVQLDDGCVPGQLASCEFGPKADYAAETTAPSFRPTEASP